MLMLKTSLYGYLLNSVNYQIRNNKPKNNKNVTNILAFTANSISNGRFKYIQKYL